MNFDWTNPLWITSQALALVALILFVIGMQMKTKNKTLFVFVIGLAFYAGSAALLSNWIMVGIFVLAMIRNVVFLLLDRHSAKVPRWASVFTLVLFMVATVTMVAFTWNWWFDFVILGFSLFSIFGAWAKGIHMIRIANACISTVVTVNNIVNANLIGVVIEVVIIISIIVFYIGFFVRRRRARRCSGLVPPAPESGDVLAVDSVAES